MATYLLDNDAGQARDRFDALESGYDAFSRRQLELTGLERGWRCLEIGAGSGSLGRWLGERVGPEGQVTMTDLEPRWAETGKLPPHVQLLRHDIVRDPLPEEGYDLVHARLVLLHLPERLEVLERLVAALRPGGWLVLDEFDCSWTPVLAAPSEAGTALFEVVHAAFLAQLEKAGADPLWGRHTVAAMARAGLTELAAATHAEAWTGGSTGMALHQANISQTARHLIADGITRDELTRFHALIEDPSFIVNSYPLISARGRRADRSRA
jgi:SAM-dependent methyltransferase